MHRPSFATTVHSQPNGLSTSWSCCQFVIPLPPSPWRAAIQYLIIGIHHSAHWQVLRHTSWHVPSVHVRGATYTFWGDALPAFLSLEQHLSPTKAPGVGGGILTPTSVPFPTVT